MLLGIVVWRREGVEREAAEMVFVNEALQLAPEMKRPQSAA